MSSRLTLPLMVSFGLVVQAAGTGVAGQVSVPLTVSDSWLVVSVVLGDDRADTLRFIVDTGASRSAVTASTTERFALPRVGRVRAHGASGPADLDVAALPELSLGGVRIRNLRALVVDDATLTPDGGRLKEDDPLDGVLGADVLRRFDVLLSAPEGSMILFDPGQTPHDVEERFSAPVPVSPASRPLLRHQVHIEGVRMTGVLDSGSRRVVLSSTAARIAGIAPEVGREERSAPGVGGQETIQRPVVVGRVQAGGLLLEAVPAHVADLPAFAALGAASVPIVLLGAPVLAHCPAFISYSAGTVRYCRGPES